MWTKQSAVCTIVTGIGYKEGDIVKTVTQ